MKITIFPGKYHQNGGFSMAMLVYRNVFIIMFESRKTIFWSVQQLVESFSSKSWWRNLESTGILVFGYFFGWWTCLSRWLWGVWPGYISFQNNCITSECRMLFGGDLRQPWCQWRDMNRDLFRFFYTSPFPSCLMKEYMWYMMMTYDLWSIMYYYINCFIWNVVGIYAYLVPKTTVFNGCLVKHSCLM